MEATSTEPQTHVTADSTPKGITLRAPMDFNGDRTKTMLFILECRAYIEANIKSFENDRQKILFMLLYMDGGTVSGWKQAYLEEIFIHNAEWDTFSTFVNKF
ncbi:hypothetical protein L208DRAFT_1465835 [Tricholoma matsutake]|nr:hypothetical protein L208DRAFT_1465835 [Tricholoma matsutake 945]